MKVLLISEPGLNGVYRHVEALAEYLMGKGVQLGLAFSSVRDSDRLHALVERIRIAGGPILDLAVANNPAPTDLPALVRLRRLVLSWKPDVLHAHSSKAGVLGRALKLVGCRQPVFYTPHAYYSMAPDVRFSWIFREVERLAGMVGTTINLCEDEAVYARKVIGIQASKQRVIANAVDLNVFRPGTTEEKQNWRKQHGLPLDALVLGTVGRYSRQKDPFTLYRALAPILQREAQVWFAHLGEGELFEPTRVLWRELGIENKVISIRYDSAPAGFYRGLDAFVLSSRYEGLALSAIEAVASDLPLILSDVPGNREFQRIGLSHVAAVPVGDAVALTHAIGLWLEDRKTPRPTNHRAVAEACFSREHCYGRVLAEYQAAVARHASCA